MGLFLTYKVTLQDIKREQDEKKEEPKLLKYKEIGRHSHHEEKRMRKGRKTPSVTLSSNISSMTVLMAREDEDEGTFYSQSEKSKLVEKDLDKSIIWFRKAITANDRLDSALKDMAMVMNQQNREDEAIKAIKSFRHLCSSKSEEALDNILASLYKKCRRIDDLIHLIKGKLRKIYSGETFNGKTERITCQNGKKVLVSMEEDMSHLLDKLGWAYMIAGKFRAAEGVNRKAMMIKPDANNACTLGHCLIKQGNLNDAKQVLLDVVNRNLSGSEDEKMRRRAEKLLQEIDSYSPSQFSVIDGKSEVEERLEAFSPSQFSVIDGKSEVEERLEASLNGWGPFSSTILPIFEEISALRDQMA